MKKIGIFFIRSLLFAGAMVSSAASQSALPELTESYLQGFFNLKSDPKALGSGGALLSQGDDINSLFWNPAGLTFANKLHGTAGWGQHGNEIKWSSLGLGSRNWGIGITGLLDSNLPLPSLVKPLPQQIPVNYGGIGRLAYGKNISGGLCAGVTLKSLYLMWQQVSSDQDTLVQKALGLSTDVGLYWQIVRFLGLGLVVQDAFGRTDCSLTHKRNNAIAKQHFKLPMQVWAEADVRFGDHAAIVFNAERLRDNPIYHFGGMVKVPLLPVNVWAGGFGDSRQIKNPRRLNWSLGMGVHVFGQQLNYTFLEEHGFSASHLLGAQVSLRSAKKVVSATPKLAKVSNERNDDKLVAVTKKRISEMVKGDEAQSRVGHAKLHAAFSASPEAMNGILSAIQGQDAAFSESISQAFKGSQGFAQNVRNMALSDYEQRSKWLRSTPAAATAADEHKPADTTPTATTSTESAETNSNHESESTGQTTELQFPENYYTFKSLFNTAQNYNLMVGELQAKLATAEIDKVFGAQETPQAWEAPNNDGQFDHFMRISHPKGEETVCCIKALIDMNKDGMPDAVACGSSWKSATGIPGWAVFFNTGSGFGQSEHWQWEDDEPLFDSYRTSSGDDYSRGIAFGRHPRYPWYDESYYPTEQKVMDINGDGYPDYVMANYENKEASPQYWKVALNQLNTPAKKKSFGKFINWRAPNSISTSTWTLAKDDGPELPDSRHYGGFELVQETMDMTGDSIPDFITYVRNGNQSWWDVYKGTAESGFEVQPIRWEFKGIDIASSSQPYFHSFEYGENHFGAICRLNVYGEVYEITKDMNSDGLPDHIFTTKEGIWHVAVNNGMGFEQPIPWNAPFKEYGAKLSGPFRLETASGTTVDDVENGNPSYPFTKQFYILLFPQDYTVMRPSVLADLIDIDGDSDADYINSQGEGDAWNVWINNGSGFDPQQKFFVPGWIKKSLHNMHEWDSKWQLVKSFALLDMNGDKCPDLVYAEQGQNDGNWQVYINNAAGPQKVARLKDELAIRSIQAKLAEGHESFFHEEYLLAQRAYESAAGQIKKYIGENPDLISQNLVEGAKRMGIDEPEANKAAVTGAAELLPENNNLAIIKKFAGSINTALSKRLIGPSSADTNVQNKAKLGAKAAKAIDGVSGSLPAESNSIGSTSFGSSVGKIKPPSDFVYKIPEIVKNLPLDVFDKNAENQYNSFLEHRAQETDLYKIILTKPICEDPQAFVFYLPYLQDFVIPLCLADIDLALGQYDNAEKKYLEAGQFQYLNNPIETKVIWQKLARLYLNQGGDLFKRSYLAGNEQEMRDHALALYSKTLNFETTFFSISQQSEQNDVAQSLKRLLDEKTKEIIHSPSKSTDSEQLPNLQEIKNQLIDLSLFQVKDGGGSVNHPVLENNPICLSNMLEALLNIAKLTGGTEKCKINYLGYSDNMLPIWRYNYLMNLARNYAQHAIQLEREYITFKTNAENESFSSQQLVQSISLNHFNQIIEKYKVEQAAWQTAISKLNEKMAALQEEAAKNAYASAKELANKSTFESVVGVVSSVAQIAAAFSTGGTSLTATSLLYTGNSVFTSTATLEQKGSTNWGGILSGAGGLLSSGANLFSSQSGDAVEQARLQWEQSKLAHEASKLQIFTSQINQQISMVQKDMAALQLSYMQDNLAYLQNKEFNAEMWYKLANSLKELSNSYLDAAIEVALLMEKAYNFETGRNIRKIRLDYSRNELSGLLAGDYLLRDIESFEYDRAVQIREKDIPVKHVISLANSRPMQFFNFAKTGQVTFATTLEEFSRAYPGAYNCRIKEVEVMVEGLLPPTGLHGTLSNGYYSVVRLPIAGQLSQPWALLDTTQLRIHGSYYDTTKTHEQETMILSKYAVREDRMVFSVPPEQLGIFENTGVACLWTLDIPHYSNNLDLNTITDIKLAITFSAQYDNQLAGVVRNQYLEERNTHAENFAELTMFSSRSQFPDQFYQFLNAKDNEKDQVLLHLPINRYNFPLNEIDPTIIDAHVVFFPNENLTKEKEFPVELQLIWSRTDSIQQRVKYKTSQDSILSYSDFEDKPATGIWTIKIEKQDYIDCGLDRLADVWLCLNYKSKLRE